MCLWYRKKPSRPIKIGDSCISCSSEETLLGILIDNKLTFDPHVEQLYKKLHKHCMPSRESLDICPLNRRN